MNLKKISMIVGLSMLCAGAAMAQTASNADNAKYFDHELQLDGFGTYFNNFDTLGHMFDRSWHHGTWGGGAGINYFFNRYMGVGVDSFFNSKGQALNNLSGNLYGRLPIGCTGLAPYIFAGGGGRFNQLDVETGNKVDEAIAQVGAGLEFRFAKWIGIFTDCRYTWADKTEGYALARAGLRFSWGWSCENK